MVLLLIVKSEKCQKPHSLDGSGACVDESVADDTESCFPHLGLIYDAPCPIGYPLGDPGPLGDLFVDLGPL